MEADHEPRADVDPNPLSLTQLGTALLQIAGAAAGLAALLYFVGVATLWIRFKTSDYPPSFAIEHVSQTTVIALGVEGLVLIALLAGGFVLVALAYRGVAAWAARSTNPDRSDRASRRARFANWVARCVNTSITKIPSGLLYLGLGVLVVGASITGWRAFGIVGAIGLAIVAMRFQRNPSTVHLSNVAFLGLLLTASGLVAIAFQVDGTNPTAAVWISRSLQSARGLPEGLPIDETPLPYFGSDGKHIFVGGLIKRADDPHKRCTYEYCTTGEIFELERGRETLTFATRTYTRNARPPFWVAWGALEGVVSDIRDRE